jgi:hypothetical protein
MTTSLGALATPFTPITASPATSDVADGKLRLAQKLLRFCVPCDPGALMFARVITESVGGLVANVISESQGPAPRNGTRLP